MTRPDIEAIRSRLNAATEGEWVPSQFHPAYVSSGDQEIAKTFTDHPNGDTGQDAAFIAGAKQDIPALLALVDERAAEISSLREALKVERAINQALRDKRGAADRSSPF